MSQADPSKADVARVDASEVISAHLARVQYEDLPRDVVAAVKDAVADCLACTLAGTAGEDVAAVRSLVEQWGGRPTSTVIGTGLKTPPDNAVLVNGAAVHQYDFDDTHDKGVCHPTPASFIPALAVAEELGNVSGKQMITAIALSNDLTSRIALAIEKRMNAYPWIRATVAGIFGATAASAKILGASAEQHRHALGLALPQTAGTIASLHNPGSSVRSIRDGLAYRNGVLAAELAMRGVRGDQEVFEGKYGLYQAYFRGEYNRGALVDELGSRYETSRVSLKPWPSCRHLHATLTALIDVMEGHQLAFDDIEQVTLHVGDVNLDRCRPVRTGMVPKHRIDLLCNLPFAVGVALLHKDLPLDVYRNGALADDVVLRAVPKINWVFDEGQNGAYLEPGKVDVLTTTKQVHRGEAKIALGHPEHPMSTQQKRQKFVNCAMAAARPLTMTQADRIFDAVMTLEEMSNIGELTRLLD